MIGVKYMKALTPVNWATNPRPMPMYSSLRVQDSAKTAAGLLVVDFVLANDVLHLALGLFGVGAYLDQHLAGFIVAALAGQPARGLGHEVHADEQQRRRQHGNGQHVAPYVRGIGEIGQQGVGRIGKELPEDDHQFVLADQAATSFGPRHFC
jgi:hypothetical protein